MADPKRPPAPAPAAAPAANKTRSEKVLTQVEGDDEFSIASTDPRARKRIAQMNLKPEGKGGGVEATQDERKIWRLFRKIFT